MRSTRVVLGLDYQHPIHPGIVLQRRLDQYGITQRAFAKRIGLSHQHVSAIIRGRRAISARAAILFAQAFGSPARYFLELQSEYDLLCIFKIMRHQVIGRTIQPYHLDPPDEASIKRADRYKQRRHMGKLRRTAAKHDGHWYDPCA